MRPREIEKSIYKSGHEGSPCAISGKLNVCEFVIDHRDDDGYSARLFAKVSSCGNNIIMRVANMKFGATCVALLVAVICVVFFLVRLVGIQIACGGRSRLIGTLYSRKKISVFSKSKFCFSPDIDV